jgi:hypothetical protein
MEGAMPKECPHIPRFAYTSIDIGFIINNNDVKKGMLWVKVLVVILNIFTKRFVRINTQSTLTSCSR